MCHPELKSAISNLVYYTLINPRDMNKNYFKLSPFNTFSIELY